MTQNELLDGLSKLRGILISVATGGAQIDTVNAEYRTTHLSISSELTRLGITQTIPFSDLWQWYGRWKNGDLPTYASRRAYIADVLAPIFSSIQSGGGQGLVPTGWSRVDRTVDEIRDRLAAAQNEEQFQTVGLLCREALISLGQEVFDEKRHPSPDGVQISKTDFKRMIEAYINAEQSGDAKQELRKHARSALDLALRLQHQRTAIFRDAAVCMEATTSVINIIAILSGRKDP